MLLINFDGTKIFIPKSNIMNDDNNPVTNGMFKVAMKKMEKRLDGTDEKFVAIDKRFVAIDKRFDAIDKRFVAIDKRFDRIETRMETFVTKDVFNSAMNIIDVRFNNLEEKMDGMYSKEDHSRFMVWMDEAMTELRDSRQERELTGHQVLRLDDKVCDHEKRIRVLEGQ